MWVKLGWIFFLEDPMKFRICSLALGLLPLTLTIGCEKKEEPPAAEETTATETTTPAEGTEATQTDATTATQTEEKKAEEAK